MHVSVRELKNHLSKYLHQKEEIIVTSHKVAVAKLVPLVSDIDNNLCFEGVVWNGKKPQGGKHRPKIKGEKTVSDYILEDRR